MLLCYEAQASKSCSADSLFLVMIHFRQLEELQLQLTKASERASQLQENLEQATRKAEEEQQEVHKKHQAELQKMQDKLSNLVRAAAWAFLQSGQEATIGQHKHSCSLLMAQVNSDAGNKCITAPANSISLSLKHSNLISRSVA